MKVTFVCASKFEILVEVYWKSHLCARVNFGGGAAENQIWDFGRIIRKILGGEAAETPNRNFWGILKFLMHVYWNFWCRYIEISDGGILKLWYIEISDGSVLKLLNSDILKFPKGRYIEIPDGMLKFLMEVCWNFWYSQVYWNFCASILKYLMEVYWNFWQRYIEISDALGTVFFRFFLFILGFEKKK